MTFVGHGEDSDGTIAAYLWKVDDAKESNEPNFVTSTLAEGLHTVSFAVQDNGGAWSASVASELVVGNIAPDAFIDSISPNPVKLDEVIVFAGHGQDSDGNIAAYKWESDVHGELSDQASFGTSAASLGAGTYTVTFRCEDDKGTWSAPATQILTVGNVKPTAYIDSITPATANVGQNVAFAGHGADVDGSIVAYSWDSSIDGHLNDANSFSTTALSLGDHSITLTVTDNDGAVSASVTQELVVNEIPFAMIIDNGQPGTSSTGTWQASGAAGFYGTNSLWSYNGATYTWSFTPTISTVYRISMWWTALSTRSNSVPVRITHSSGTTNLTVNQRTNGGQWNNLGEYTLNADATYSVHMTAPSGSPPSTCADAVKFEKMAAPSLPIANFTANQTTGGIPLIVQFTDTSLGIIASRLWDFGDGTTSTETNPTHTYAVVGKYTVSLTVTNAAGADSETKDNYIETVSDHENIYVCGIYSWNNGLTIYTESMLQDIGATKISTDHWVYTARGRTYFINMVRTVEGMEAALKEEGAHVVVAGHSNFGFGAVFATSNEFRDQEILDIRYVDDDRFVKFSSDMVSVKPDGMKYGQAYPNWTTNRKDGTSSVMPYTFAEAKARGTLPPYNYYMTYQRPGDPNVYKTELSNGAYLQRFADSGVPAWYSPTGSPPDPCLNPEYFIVNNDPDYNRFETIGTWPFAKVIGGGYMGEAGYLGYNYQYHEPGTGSNKATWTSYIRFPGVYAIMASWFPSPLNATNARYTIHHTDIGAGDTTVVDVNQQTGAFVNLLAVVYLTP
ncbi:MAG: PKD domain-containing protein, partial [Sideroxyarcus sp.]|nr:PKD domain-containing protein [Sideroxyarcus sp.]